MKYEAEVTAGADLLDQMSPGWEHQVRPDDLAMGSCSFCVLGQLYGHYTDGLELLNLNVSRVSCEDVEFGFCLPDLTARRDREIDWQELADAWRAEIIRRKNRKIEASPPPVEVVEEEAVLS